jgi:hypothetical protein
MVVHACNSSTWKAEAGGSQVPDQLGYIARSGNKTKGGGYGYMYSFIHLYNLSI